MYKIKSRNSEPDARAEIRHYNSLEEALNNLYDSEVSVQNKEAVYGGDINESFRLSLSNNVDVFLKTNSISNQRFFITESRGLAALASSGKIGVPKVYATGCDKKAGYSFLLMEYLDQGSRVKDYWEQFGHELAMLHHTEINALDLRLNNISDIYDDKCYGFVEDNYIGANPQKNEYRTSWIEFYRDCRLIPQITMAENLLDRSLKKKLEQLLAHLDQYLREPDTASLLHGDLWSGNAICGPDGKAWIIDPAVYIGDRETDLAMTQLFGGFPSAFYASYHETFPIDSGYKDRKLLYDLYHILNHANLFGRGYLSQAMDILNYYEG